MSTPSRRTPVQPMRPQHLIHHLPALGVGLLLDRPRRRRSRRWPGEHLVLGEARVVDRLDQLAQPADRDRADLAEHPEEGQPADVLLAVLAGPGGDLARGGEEPLAQVVLHRGQRDRRRADQLGHLHGPLLESLDSYVKIVPLSKSRKYHYPGGVSWRSQPGAAAVRRSGPGRAEGCAGRVVHGALARGVDGDDGSVVVFLIGMRINRWRKVRTWWPVFVGMPRCCASWPPGRRSGCSGSSTYWAGRNFVTVQYWRSAEHLGRFARDPEMLHQPAWAAFNRAGAGTGDVGIWHETFLVPRPTSSRSTATCPSTGSAPRSARSRAGNTGGPAPRTRWASRTRSTSRPDAGARQQRFRDARRLSAWISSSSSWCSPPSSAPSSLPRSAVSGGRWRRRPPSSSP